MEKKLRWEKSLDRIWNPVDSATDRWLGRGRNVSIFFVLPRVMDLFRQL